MEMQKTRDELNQKISEVGRLQKELRRSAQEESSDTIEKLKNTIATLQDENRSIKVIVLPCLVMHPFESMNTFMRVFILLCRLFVVVSYVFGHSWNTFIIIGTNIFPL